MSMLKSPSSVMYSISTCSPARQGAETWGQTLRTNPRSHPQALAITRPLAIELSVQSTIRSPLAAFPSPKHAVGKVLLHCQMSIPERGETCVNIG